MCDIPEGRGIFPSLTVRENLVLQFRSGRAEESINTAVDAFPSLGRHLNQMAGSLSGGEQQMLALTRAHASQAKVVMVDEVSLGLAPVVVDRLFEFLSAMVTGGTALLIVEQYVSRALELASHAYLLNRGAIVFDGPSSQLSAGDIFQHYLSIDVAPRAGRKVGTQGKKDAPSD
jgi:branched-chain amino acid transport system ATP-binding protein